MTDCFECKITKECIHDMAQINALIMSMSEKQALLSFAKGYSLDKLYMANVTMIVTTMFILHSKKEKLLELLKNIGEMISYPQEENIRVYETYAQEIRKLRILPPKSPAKDNVIPFCPKHSTES